MAKKPEQAKLMQIGPRIPEPKVFTPQQIEARRQRNNEAIIHGTMGMRVARALVDLADGADELTLDAGTHTLTVTVTPK